MIQILSLPQDFEDLFDGTLGDGDTNTAELELKTDYKPFDCKYYMVYRINKDAFIKELQCLV